MSALAYDKDALARLCRSCRIRRLALFGSVTKGTDRPGSDVDLLVEFEPGAVPGFLGLARIEARLSELMGRRVDLRTPNELSPHFRQAVERAADTCFAG